MDTHDRRPASFGGFTAIELLVVIAVLGILATVAVPSFSNLMAKNRVKGTASNLQLALLKARSEAVKRNATVTLSPVTAGDWTSGWRVRDGATVISEQGEIEQLTISGAPASVTYVSSGRVSAGAAPSFEVQDARVATMKRCVSVDLSGRPYVKEGACS